MRIVLSALVGLAVVACGPSGSQQAPATTSTGSGQSPSPSAAAKPSPSAVASASPGLGANTTIANASPGPTRPSAPQASAVASPSVSPPTDGRARAELRTAQGQVVATITLTEDGTNPLRVQVDARDLPPGRHGIHFHAVGRCEPTDFVSAGGHYNPNSREHGLENPNGPHAGDLPNLEIGPGGAGQLDVTTDRVTVRAGASSLFDADGSSIVIHANEDDQRTDPSGSSGNRIACGEVRTGAL